MAMKKKFLGLALATAIALPASSVYATGDTTRIEFENTATQNYDVTVKGSIKNKQGQAPAGKIEVELPTTMSFTVDQNGKFTGTEYRVTNKSQEAITVSLGDFTETQPGGGIELVEIAENGEMAGKKRNEVKMALLGDNTHIDLSKAAEHKGKKLIDVEGNNNVGTIQLAGVAGTEDIVGDTSDKGVSEDFKLVLQIKKKID